MGKRRFIITAAGSIALLSAASASHAALLNGPLDFSSELGMGNFVWGDSVPEVASVDFTTFDFSGPTKLSVSLTGNGFSSLGMTLYNLSNGEAVPGSSVTYNTTDIALASPLELSLDNGAYFAVIFGLPTNVLSGTGTFHLAVNEVTTAPVPLPPAAWLLGSALVGMTGISRRKQAKA